MRVIDDTSKRDMPLRPSLPASFSGGCAFWLAIASAYSFGRIMDVQFCFEAAVVAIVLAVLLGLLFFVVWRFALLFCAVAALVGLCLGWATACTCHASAASGLFASSAEIEVEIIGDSKATSRGECAFAKKKTAQGDVIVYLAIERGQPMLNGDRVRVSGSFVEADYADSEYLWNNCAVGTIYAHTYTLLEPQTPLSAIRSVRKEAIQNMASQGDAGMLVVALACGYRHELSASPVYAAFQRTGLAHLVAVSGAHLVIVTGLFASLLKALKVPRRISIAVLAAIMALYLVISGVPVSALRATIMSSVGISSLYGKRRPSSLSALGICMFAVLASNPSTSISASFALSALSTMGIILFAPLVQAWLDRIPLSKVGFVVDALALSIASNILSLPYACSLFHQVPLIGPIANVVVAPLFPLVCAFALFAALFSAFSFPGTSLLLLVSSAAAKLLAHVVKALSTVPYASVPMSMTGTTACALTISFGVLLWVTWPRFSLRAASFAVLSLAVLFGVHAAVVFQEDSIIMLDVGQGDAFLIRSRGSTMLIDTGNHDAQLIEQLAKSGTMYLDAVLITHADDDHCGSLDALSRAVHVGEVVLFEDAFASDADKNVRLVRQAAETGDAVSSVRYMDELHVGAFTLTEVWPKRYSDEGGNADSVCLYVTYDGNFDGVEDARALFTGDAECDQLQAILKTSHISGIDLLKVGHHGSKDAITANQAQELSPSMAFIGVGERNRYGHPAQSTLDVLEDVGCEVFRSDRDGQVKCTFSAESLRVSLQ